MRAFRFNPVLRYKEAVRFRQVVNTFLAHGVGTFLDTRGSFLRLKRLFKKDAHAYPAHVRFRMALESLGPTFIKLGQILSTRADILPEEWVKELMKLRDELPPNSWDEIEEVLISELGRDYERLFSYIEPVPIGSASMAQVHRARLKTGERVVIKVLRPHIEETVEIDIAVLRRIAAFIHKHFEEFRIYDFPSLVEEFAFTIKREMDFRIEAANSERIAKILADEGVKIPGVFWDYTTRRVLVLEEVEGVKLEKWQGEREEACRLAEKLVYVLLKQIIEGDIFHADPHPANVIVTSCGSFAFVDFGMVGFLDRKMRQFVGKIFLYIVNRDYDAIVSEYKRMNLVERMDERRFKLELMGLVEPYLVSRLSRIDLGDVVRRVIEISSRYGVKFPSEFLMLARALLVMDGTVRGLCGDINVLELVADYARDVESKRGRMEVLAEELREFQADIKRVREDLKVILFSGAELALKAKDEGIRVKVMQDEIREKEMRSLGNRLVASTVSVGFFLGSIFAYGLKVGWFKGFPVLSLALLVAALFTFLLSLKL